MRLYAASGYEAVDEQDDDSAEDGHDQAPEIEPDELGTPCKELEEEPSDERPEDTEQHRYYAAARVAPRHDELGEGSGYEAEEDPAYYSHGFLQT
jgi:hypothetical protein